MENFRSFVLDPGDSKEFVDEGDTFLVVGFCVVFELSLRYFKEIFRSNIVIGL